MAQKKPSIQALRKDSSTLKVIFVAILLTLSLSLALMIMQTPQDIRQRAQRPAPMCAAAADATGICRAAGGCFLGEETDAGALDCGTGQTCCGLAPVPPQCAAINSATTFCATEPACADYGGKNEGQLDCQAGTICCNNPNALLTTTPGAPTSLVPSPTFGTINVPTEEPEPNNPEPTEPQPPADPPAQNPSTPAPANQNILVQLIILIITLILGLFGR